MKYFCLALLVIATSVMAENDIASLYPELKPIPGKQDVYTGPDGKEYDAETLIERAAKYRLNYFKKDQSTENLAAFLEIYIQFGQDSEILLPYLAEVQKDYTAQLARTLKTLNAKDQEAVKAGVDAAKEL